MVDIHLGLQEFDFEVQSTCYNDDVMSSDKKNMRNETMVEMECKACCEVVRLAFEANRCSCGQAVGYCGGGIRGMVYVNENAQNVQGVESHKVKVVNMA